MAKRRKQTADSFPSDLSYTQGRVWVRRGLGDTATIGLNVPAISERIANIYFIDLQPRGYVIEGKQFGAADLDTARVKLKAPFSGRIARVNWEAVADPLLVMTDPFGKGWLYEVTRVKPEAYANLLDRDAFWSYLDFERRALRLGIKPVLNARYRFDRQMPVWPDDLHVTFGGLTVLTGRILRLGRNAVFTPQWSPGESWKVEVRFEQPSAAMIPEAFGAQPEMVTVRWLYEVVDANAVLAGEECYVVKAIETGGPKPQTYFRLTIAKDDFGLRQVEEVSVHDAARRTLTPNDWGKESYMELREPRSILLDLPLFPAENQDEDRTIDVAGEPEVHQRARFPDAKTMEIACDARWGAETLTSTQTWERGLPWWRKAERRVGDKVVMTGKLIRT